MKSADSFLAELIGRFPLLKTVQPAIWRAFQLIAGSYRKGGKLLIAGNGGSAADSNHIVGELMKGFLSKRPLPAELQRKILEGCDGVRNSGGRDSAGWDPGQALAEGLQQALPAISLTEHGSLTTAFNNDVDAALTYAQQVLGYGKRGDVFLGITTSGNSRNIVNAAYLARVMDLQTIGLTGECGGLLARITDVCITVPEKETYLVQELHLPVYHTLCMMLENEFFL